MSDFGVRKPMGKASDPDTRKVFAQANEILKGVEFTGPMTRGDPPALTTYRVTAEVTLRLETTVEAASQTDAELAGLDEVRSMGEMVSYKTHSEPT